MSLNGRAVLFARSNSGAAAIDEHVRALTKYAKDNGIKVVAKVTMPHCSAHEFDVQANLTALIGRGRGHNKVGMVIVTDLSRLSRRSVPHAMNLIKKLAAAGVAVVTPPLGVVDDSLWRSFPLVMKGWSQRKKKSAAVRLGKKDVNPDGSKEGSAVPDHEEGAKSRPQPSSGSAANCIRTNHFRGGTQPVVGGTRPLRGRPQERNE